MKSWTNFGRQLVITFWRPIPILDHFTRNIKFLAVTNVYEQACFDPSKCHYSLIQKVYPINFESEYKSQNKLEVSLSCHFAPRKSCNMQIFLLRSKIDSFENGPYDTSLLSCFVGWKKKHFSLHSKTWFLNLLGKRVQFHDLSQLSLGVRAFSIVSRAYNGV